MCLFISSTVDYTSIQTDNFEPECSDTDVVACTKEILKIYSFQTNSKNIFTKVDSEKPNVFWLTDKDRLEVILSTIIFNSVKFTNSGNIKVKIDVHSKDSYQKISVIDTGCGMEHEELSNLQEALVNNLTSTTTANSSGLGLGLRIVSSILKYLAPRDHNKQFIKSEKNVGTTVTFYQKNLASKNIREVQEDQEEERDRMTQQLIANQYIMLSEANFGGISNSLTNSSRKFMNSNKSKLQQNDANSEKTIDCSSLEMVNMCNMNRVVSQNLAGDITGLFQSGLAKNQAGLQFGNRLTDKVDSNQKNIAESEPLVKQNSQWFSVDENSHNTSLGDKKHIEENSHSTSLGDKMPRSKFSQKSKGMITGMELGKIRETSEGEDKLHSSCEKSNNNYLSDENNDASGNKNKKIGDNDNGNVLGQLVPIKPPPSFVKLTDMKKIKKTDNYIDGLENVSDHQQPRNSLSANDSEDQHSITIPYTNSFTQDEAGSLILELRAKGTLNSNSNSQFSHNNSNSIATVNALNNVNPIAEVYVF